MTDILMIPSSDYLYTYEYTTYKYTNWRSYDRKRKKLQHLNTLYGSNRFEYLVVFDRRRVGKTTILQKFSKNTNTIFYLAKGKNDALNLERLFNNDTASFRSFFHCLLSNLGSCFTLHHSEDHNQNSSHY